MCRPKNSLVFPKDNGKSAVTTCLQILQFVSSFSNAKPFRSSNLRCTSLNTTLR